MTQFLPPNLLALFAARDPIRYLPPTDKLSWEKKTDGYAGIAHLLHRFEDPKDTPPPTRVEKREERLDRKRREKAEQMAYKLEQEIAMWEPHNNAEATVDPYKTLFVARINFDTSESKLRREFEIYGSIKKIVVVHNTKTGKPRGYAFIEYEHERDMHSAYKHADGKKLDNRRVLVDVERSRTVKGWLPRRLGGGLGGTRKGGPDVNVRHSGRDDNDRSKRRDDDRFGASGEREREPRPERERERRATSRPRDKDRERIRSKRSRSRDRKRRRSRSKDKDVEITGEGATDRDAKRRHRSRSPRDRKRRSRSPRDRKHRRDRDRERKERGGMEGEEMVRVKDEPVDDYPDFGPDYYNNFPLKEEDDIKNGPKPDPDQEEENNIPQHEIDY